MVYLYIFHIFLVSAVICLFFVFLVHYINNFFAHSHHYSSVGIVFMKKQTEKIGKNKFNEIDCIHLTKWTCLPIRVYDLLIEICFCQYKYIKSVKITDIKLLKNLRLV